MFESLDGLLTACTRQNGGRSFTVTVCDTISVPPVTIVASVTVVPSKVRPFSAAHSVGVLAATGAEAGRAAGACAESPVSAATMAMSDPANNLRVMTSLRDAQIMN